MDLAKSRSLAMLLWTAPARGESDELAGTISGTIRARATFPQLEAIGGMDDAIRET